MDWLTGGIGEMAFTKGLTLGLKIAGVSSAVLFLFGYVLGKKRSA